MNYEIYQLGKRLDSINYQEVQADIIPILEKGSNLVLDMTTCGYVSSAGLRILLYSKKVAASKGLNVYLVGIADRVKDIMKITGFGNFFDTFSTMEECLAKINS